jgi:hypothetical protein
MQILQEIRLRTSEQAFPADELTRSTRQRTLAAAGIAAGYRHLFSIAFLNRGTDTP